jgi:hypothetical protein
VVAEVRPRRVEDRVVVSPAQAEGDFAGHRRTDPALERLAQHERLRVEPAALVHEAPEPTALGVVIRDGVLVVDRVQQPLVRDVEQGHSRGLVDASALRLDDAILDLVRDTEPVATADRVGLEHEGHRVGVLDAVDGHGSPGVEANCHDLRGNLDVVAPRGDTHDRGRRCRGSS